MNIEESIKEAIKEEALKAKPYECCGLIIKDRSEGHRKIWPAINSAPEPEENFIIKIHDYIMAEEVGDVIGVYHSHPKGNSSFSDADTVNAQKLELLTVLYVVEQDKFHFFQPETED